MRILYIEDKPFHEIQFITAAPKGKIRKCTLPFFRVFVDALPDRMTSFAATSDLQGRDPGQKNRLLGEVVAEELSVLYEMVQVPKIDLVLLAGDLYEYPDCHKLGDTGDVTDVYNAFADQFDAVIGVHSNHDTVEEDKLKNNVIILDSNSTTQQGLNIGGVSGIIGTNNRNQRKEIDVFLKCLTKVTARKNDVILLHQGPNDPLGYQRGEPLIRKHLEKKRDRLGYIWSFALEKSND